MPYDVWALPTFSLLPFFHYRQSELSQSRDKQDISCLNLLPHRGLPCGMALLGPPALWRLPWSLWCGGPTSPVPITAFLLCYCNYSLPCQPPLMDTKPCEPRGYVLFYFQGLTECPANRRCWNRSVEWMIDWHMKEKPLKRQKEWKQESEITSGILHWCEFLFVMNPINKHLK